MLDQNFRDFECQASNLTLKYITSSLIEFNKGKYIYSNIFF